ncbi:MAG: bifunctional enoyl-CoA hydratase/phosphate acetyltransferase [Candidatus Omnitrophica bacterium]|nr:bifunctional enoyl-CoA hydratase/phosphate acetyltransferase [Candidatus Omnitrophota bacterium]
MRTFKEVIKKIGDYPVKTVAVVVADDENVLLAVKKAYEANIAKAVLFGRKTEIEKILKTINFLSSELTIVDTADDYSSARAACVSVRDKKADILMKGKIHTADFLRAVLDRQSGFRIGTFMSHVFVLERSDKLLLVSDGAMNISPKLPEKVKIIFNALKICRVLDIENPKVAVLAALEVVNPAMPATVEAASLRAMAEQGKFGYDCFVDGPFALDNAIDQNAANLKGVTGDVAGKADVLIVPNIESGNILAKSFVYLAKGSIAGVLVGAAVPIVLTSRADSCESKFYSIALSVLMSDSS